MSYKPRYIDNKEYLEHKAKYGTPLTIRLNKVEQDIVTQWKEEADIKTDSEAIKSLMIYGFNVIHGESTAPTLSRLFKKERTRRT